MFEITEISVEMINIFSHFISILLNSGQHLEISKVSIYLNPLEILRSTQDSNNRSHDP